MTGSNGRLVQVIGVAADVKEMYSNRAARWYLYRPLRATEFGIASRWSCAPTGDPGALVAVVQEQVRALDPALPARSVSTTRERMKLPLWPARTAAGFLTVCGTLALVLATVGLFGVTYYTVSQRTREFGIRVALGARPRNVMTLVLREGFTLSAAGVAIGIGGALVAVRLVSNTLIGVGPSDPLHLSGCGRAADCGCAGGMRAAGGPRHAIGPDAGSSTGMNSNSQRSNDPRRAIRASWVKSVTPSYAPAFHPALRATLLGSLDCSIVGS